MKAIVLASPGKVALADVPEPRLEEPTDALVRVTLAGICGSDLHIVDGRDRGCRMGTVMGHEIVGVVEAVGSGVQTLRVGDRVVAPFTVNCGRCFFCARELPARCERSLGFGFVNEGGVGLQGGQGEFVRVPFADATLLRIPDRHDDGLGVDDADVLFLGDILATAWGAVQAGRAHPGDTIVVVGCGPVGLLCVHLASLLSPAQVIAVETVAARVEQAQAYGAIAFSPARALAEVRACTGGRGADVVIEAVGSKPALDLAFSLLRPGGVLSCAGYHTDPVYPLPIEEAYGKNLTLVIGRGNARHHMNTLLPMVLARRLRHREILTHNLPLAEGVQAYAMFATRAQGAIKVLLRP